MIEANVLEYCTFTHPRRSSDSCLRVTAPAQPDGVVAVYGIADMIGHPTALRWRNYVRTVERQLKHGLRDHAIPDLAALDELLSDEIIRHSAQISKIRSRHDLEAFGFCICMAAVVGTECRIHWLGDCRAYHITRTGIDPASDLTYRVHCLTRDHNRFGDIMQSSDDFTVFQNETLGMTKRLGCYLGIHDDDLARQTLKTSQASVTVHPGDGILFLTDGAYMPHLRGMMTAANFRLTRSSYYLEEWLSRLFTEGDRRVPKDDPDYWPELLTFFVDRTLRQATHHRRYRDDIAILGLYNPID